MKNVPTFFYGNDKGFLSKKSFERLRRGTLSGDEIGRFLCLGVKCLPKTRVQECSDLLSSINIELCGFWGVAGRHFSQTHGPCSSRLHAYIALAGFFSLQLAVPQTLQGVFAATKAGGSLWPTVQAFGGSVGAFFISPVCSPLI